VRVLALSIFSAASSWKRGASAQIKARHTSLRGQHRQCHPMEPRLPFLLLLILLLVLLLRARHPLRPTLSSVVVSCWSRRGARPAAEAVAAYSTDNFAAPCDLICAYQRSARYCEQTPRSRFFSATVIVLGAAHPAGMYSDQTKA